MKSEQINELAAALSKAQGEMENASMDSENPHFRSKYASLASFINAAKKSLTKNGLAVVQYNTLDNNLVTELVHSSGQWIRGETKLLIAKPDMQGFKSANTYARRMAFAGMIGLAEDDDDANEAVINKQIPKKEIANHAEKVKISKTQIDRLLEFCSGKGITQEQLEAGCKRDFNCSLSELTLQQFSQLERKIMEKK